MSLYRKLDCLCSHEFYSHKPTCGLCSCPDYEANGHNPELENIVCPRCSLTRLEKVDDLYICVACSKTLTERQVWGLVG
ncbi:MAG: hypothetical protein ACREBR_05145 [bacterium]